MLPAFGPRRTTSIPSPVGKVVERVTELGLEHLAVLERSERQVLSSSRVSGVPHEEQ